MEASEITLGNRNRHIWKQMCHQLALQPGLNSFDRAIYSYMAGDVTLILPVCQTWEDIIWARYHALLDTEIDVKLSQLPCMSCFQVEKLNFSSPPAPLKPVEIFESVKKHENERIKASAHEPFHLIQTDIILNHIQSLYERLSEQTLLLDATLEGPP
jgi:nuclear pore complex protein Nup107